MLDAGTTVAELLKSIRTQVDILTALSSGGLGMILFRVIGYDNGKLYIPSKDTLIILISGFLFIIAIVAGFITTSFITGFWTEMTFLYSQIDDAREYLKVDPLLGVARLLSFIQLISSLFGVIGTSLYVWRNATKEEQ